MKPKELPAPKIDKTLPPKPDPDPKPIFPEPSKNPDPKFDPNVSNLFGDELPVIDDTPPAPTRYPSSNPQFPGGEEAMFRYLQHNLKYPEMAKDYNVQGRVYVEFIVDVDGSIRDLKIRRGIPGNDLGCEEEAMRVIRSMPKWSPGKQGDKKVPVIYTLPINFVLK
jgi:protein TonB